MMWISFSLNILIVIMVIFSLYAMYIGWDFMGSAGHYDSPGAQMFRYFTIDSNVLMAFCSLIVAVAQFSVLMGRSEELAAWVYAVKLMGSSAVMLTFMVTVFFLVPQFEKPLTLFYNSNFFLHLVVPLTAALSFVFLDKTESISFAITPIGALPTAIYAVYYLAEIFRHLKDGQVDRAYDFYNFLNGKKELAPMVACIVILISYLLGLLLWWGNRL